MVPLGTPLFGVMEPLGIAPADGEDLQEWAKRAAPYLLGLGARENGKSLTFSG